MRILIIFVLLLTSFAWANDDPDLATKDVIFLGESHNSQIDHAGQLQVLQYLRSVSNKPVVVLAEMFHEKAESRLQAFAESQTQVDFEPDFWKAQWGHPYELYRPIFEFVKQQNLTLTHLRPDPVRTSSVKKLGAVSAVDLLGDFMLGPVAYKKHLTEIAMAHMPKGGGGHVISPDLMNQFFLVQCFWDEYMSWRISEVRKAHPESQLVVLVGHGHLHRDFGIQPRLLRRSPGLDVITFGFERKINWQPDFFFVLQSAVPPRVEIDRIKSVEP